MNDSQVVTTQQLPAAAADDRETMEQLAGLINRVYAAAEDGLWRPGASRTNVEELRRFTKGGEIVVARIGDEIVGSIRVQQLDARTAETGMLVSAPERRGLGIGTLLRQHAVGLLRQRGVETLQIELLVPRGKVQQSKEFMAAWNARDGFEVVRQGAFEEYYPELAPQLATLCDFIIYNKAL